MKIKSNHFHFLALTCSALLMASSASALTYYWDNNGSGTTGFGTAGGTWADMGSLLFSQSSSGGADATLGSSVITTTADSINFGTNVAGNGLATGSITVSGTVNSGDMTFGSQSGAITLSGGIINFANSVTITVNSSTSVATIDSQITGASTSLIRSNVNGTLRLTNVNNSYSGQTIVVGVLEVASLSNGGLNSSIGTSSNAAGNLSLGSFNRAGTLRYIGSTNVATDRLFTLDNNAANGNGAIESSGTGTMNFTNTGAMVVTGTTNARSFTLGGTNTGANTLNPLLANGTGGPILSIIKSGTGNWILANKSNSYTGSTTINGGTLIVSKMADYDTVSSIGKGTSGTGIAIGSGGVTATLEYTGTGDSTNRFIRVGSFSTSNGGSTILNNGSGALHFTGAIFNENFSSNSSGARTITLGGANGGSISGTVQNASNPIALAKIGGGTWTLIGNNTFTASTTLSAGTLKLDYSTNNTSKLSNTASIGTLALNGGTLELCGGSHAETVLSTTMGGGTNFIKQTGGGSSNLSTGVIAYSGGALNFAAADIANVSTSTVTNGILSGAAGTARVTVGGADWAAKDGSNNVIAYTGYDTTFSGGATAPNVNYSIDGSQGDSGVIILTGNRGASTNTFKITTSGNNQSMALGANQLTLGSMLFAGANDYSITNTTGRIQSAFLLHNYGSGTLSLGTTNGQITQYGTGKTILTGNNLSDVGIAIGGGTVQFSNNLQIGTNATVKTISLNNGTLLADTSGGNIALDSSGSLSRTISLGAGGGRLDVAGGGKLIVSGVISDSTAGQFPTLTIGSASSNGTIELTGMNTYSGQTTIAGGTLKLGANNVLPNGSTVSIGNATLDADTRTDLAGTLNVTGSAVINLGSGSSLSFADSSETGAGTWAGTLNITGTLGATSLKFGNDNTGLSAEQLSKITVNGSGLGTFTLDSNGYLIAGSGGGDLTPPTLTSITDDKAGGPIVINTQITYTINFNEDIDSDSFNTDDLDNNGTALITIGTISETSPGVFTVLVTPTSSGTLNLRIPNGAVVKDLAANNLVVPVADDNTIIVQTPYEFWSGGLAFGADANGDGVSNGLAFLLGAPGPNVSALGKLPTASLSGGNLILSFQSLKDAHRGSATLSVEHSSDLGIVDAWLAAPVTDAGSPLNNVSFSVSSASATLNNITATISSSEANAGKLFGRIKAVNP